LASGRPHEGIIGNVGDNKAEKVGVTKDEVHGRAGRTGHGVGGGWRRVGYCE
jgi:hypothetical protein